jgi:hypothetical protein
MRGTKGDYYDYSFMTKEAVGGWVADWARQIRDKRNEGDTRYIELVDAYNALVELDNLKIVPVTPEAMDTVLKLVNTKIEAVYDELESSVHWGQRPHRHIGKMVW